MPSPFDNVQTQGGIFDTLLGPPAALRQQREAQRFQYAKEQQAFGREQALQSSQAQALQSVAQMRLDNPDVSGQQLINMWLNNPESGGQFVRENPRAFTPDFIGKLKESITNPMQVVGKNQGLYEIRPGAGGAPEAREMVGAQPEPTWTIVQGGTKEADALGLKYLKEDESIAAATIPGPDGFPVVVDLKDPGGGGVTITNQLEGAGAKRRGILLTNRNFDETKRRGELYDAAAMVQSLERTLGADPIKAQSRYGILGSATQWAESFITQGRAIADQFGLAWGEEADQKYWTRLYEDYPILKEAVPSALARSKVTGLVFKLAKIFAGQEGRDLSDKDVNRMFDMIGARAGSTTQLIAGVRNVLRGGFRAAKIRHDIGKDLYEGATIKPLSDPYAQATEMGFGDLLPKPIEEKAAPQRTETPEVPAGPFTAEQIKAMPYEEVQDIDPRQLEGNALDALIERLGGGK